MHYKYKKILGNTIIYLLLLIVFIFTVFPLFYTFMGSFKSNMELLANSGRLIPEKFITDNYVQAWKLANFKQYTFNSIFLSFFVVVGTIFTSTIAGYVFERGNFRLKNFLFAMVVSSMFVSLGSLTLYPQLMTAKFFGINKSLWGVIIIRVFGLNVTNLFVTRSYIRTISPEIDESAKVDGCTFFRIYRSIIFPLLKPLIATLAILEFRFAWNDYLMPMVFTLSNPKRMPLVVGIMNLKGTGAAASSWNLMLAGTSIAIIPMIVVYVIFNRYFIKGLTAGAVKG
ncbi:multiple sugar transport system permease protein [Herbinix hemicellulosilytica]|uniref:Putative membrane protein n=1 Tax=Herbinix hemicellulosilytica TaxID=1564487 RepID=A0A0H5SHD7_HERHM|nr:carbohydrate ABC transporter permease [Herbinix hemicellulosilytica]RBP60788.1 multiple sugar transport system permease protein [Herbinix hemicellulosilytica]CRZ34475.1 putative membrane protein [Herbinix hemicellulosilytica]